MYLKSIKANGFKSFAEKTDFELDKGITGIVGPNGSGKSNVVDAIRWVLGEQSIKSLRGEGSMTDVIFQGSKSRDAKKMASVSLTFDNSDHYLNSEFDELEIKRIVYNTGDNEYLINNTKARLKDITNLFMDSGVDKEAFNIISQGEVTSIVNSKPYERRSMFESAARVMKYRKRKEESLRKLEKTNENLTRIKLLVNELSESVLPLKEQAEKARKYLDLKEELSGSEIALIVNDITTINSDYNTLKVELEHLMEEIKSIEENNTSKTAEIELLKLQKIKMEESLSSLNDELLKLQEELASLDSEKRINIERQKMNYKEDDSNINLLKLKEEMLSLEKNIQIIENDITNLNSHNEELKKNLTSAEIDKQNYSLKLKSLNDSLMEKNQTLFRLNNEIKITENNALGDGLLPYPVKCIINNPRLRTCGTFGSLLSYDKKYAIALEAAIGYNYNVIVVRNEVDAKDAINYLKTNNLGRATFFPINIIKPKKIDPETLNRLEQVNGFIDVASNLIEVEKDYQAILENQLGNVIVVKDVDALNMIGRIINYSYRIVTLEGEISHAGGSLTGGSAKNNNSAIKEKLHLETLINDKDLLEKDIKKIEEEIKVVKNDLELVEPVINKVNNDIISNNQLIYLKNANLNEINTNLNNLKSEYQGIDSISNNKIDELMDEILKKYYDASAKKDILVSNINNTKSELNELNNKISFLENDERIKNSKYRELQNDIKNHEVKIAKYDVSLDNLLINLSENYNLTYEAAKDEYELNGDVDTVRKEVNHLKLEIKALGDVNTGSISEYERISTRYDFLVKQQTDLEKSVESLLGIISEMDEIMKDKFLDTFNKIKAEFSVVFKALFKGGEGTLRLTDPDNLLETGVEILAVPPGKKISSNTLLSGGEKTLTAIALLFSILNVKKAPFCVLDEVEAALDEVNVDMFGHFLREKKDSSQFIIITHKKRTMEYADYLYGITMQESGVSKLVSVKLADIEK